MKTPERVDLASLQKLVDSLPALIFANRADGYLDFCNQRMLDYVGLPFEELEGWKWGAVVHPDDATPLSEKWQASLASGEPFECEARVRRADGEYRWMLHREVAVRDGSGQVVRWYGSSIDIEDRKQAEDAQRRAEAALQQARTALAHRQRVSLLGEVAASLAHEIKQPIAAARIDAKVCLRALTDDRLDVQAAREAAARMVKDAMSADEIIRRTTALYEKDTTNRERVDTNELVRDMGILLQQEATASSVSIRTDLAEGIPDVMADRVQLQQVFMNLMLNAIEAMKDTDGGELRITSQASHEGELLIAVTDTGVGLPAEHPDQIFDSFVTTKPHGTGMGLAITRSIVESHGGRLWATANAGPGATFLFTLLTEAGEQRPSPSPDRVSRRPAM